MGKIQELSTLLTNQIAAGEVIERPSSVVKELLENAVDASSTRIVIDIEEAGLKRIRIQDDGTGMSADDAKLSIKRHTTSKIYSPEQLFRIKTLGFRGEALASITAVSKMTLTTATGEGAGTQLVIEGGTIVSETQVPPIQGTTMDVTELFYNTPARLKFVRTLQTEVAHITDVVTKLSLSHPEIAFILRNDGNELIRTSGNGDLRQAIAGNLGPTNARKLLPFQGENADFRVSGYTSLPELTRSNRNYLSIFVNGRAIRNLAISKAIVAGYGSTLMIGRFPICVLNIEMDYQLVDVNVHPTKQEVRISQEMELSEVIRQAIHEAVQGVQRIPESMEDLSFKRKNPLLAAERPKVEQGQFQFSFESSRNFDFPAKYEQSEKNRDTIQEKVEELSSEEASVPPLHPNVAGQKNMEESIPLSREELMEEWVDEHEAHADYMALAKREDETEFQTGFPELHYFGQMHGTYLFAQNESGLYMIDQHAAQERIKYEQFKVSIGEVAPVLQPLMIPIVLEFSKKEAIRLQERLALVQEMGIEVEPFGPQTFQVQSHPAWIPKGQEREVVEEVIDWILADKQVTVAELRKATAIMMSCKGSIKANHHLSDMEARRLLEDLSMCKNPYNCPHGRPVLVHLTNKDLEKLFKRIQDPHHSQQLFDE